MMELINRKPNRIIITKQEAKSGVVPKVGKFSEFQPIWGNIMVEKMVRIS